MVLVPVLDSVQRPPTYTSQNITHRQVLNLAHELTEDVTDMPKH